LAHQLYDLLVENKCFHLGGFSSKRQHTTWLSFYRWLTAAFGLLDS